MKTALFLLILFAGFCAVSLWRFLSHAKFGARPRGPRLERIRSSPNYHHGAFRNLLPTPMMTGEKGLFKSTLEFFFKGSQRRKPQGVIPSLRHDLRGLNPAENLFVWLGHSSYLLQIEGQRILVDPVLSGNASPVSFTTKAFPGADPYTADDLPEIDLLILTHDHWDHLDYETVTRLRPRVQRVLCGLGVGAHLEAWGYAPRQIVEGDWGDRLALDGGWTAHVLPARHFSGRTLRRSQTLWASFALVSPRGTKIYLGGDGGYGPHFQAIGQQFGGFDLAVLENGQYDPAWKHVHMMPEETLQAACDLQAALLFPVHNSKFCICNHAWDAPLRSITALAQPHHPQLITPVLGDVVNLATPAAASTPWWTTVA